MLRLKLAAALASVVLCCSLLSTGCGSGESVPPNEAAIQALVVDVSDASFDEQRFADMFVTNTAPSESERLRFRVYMYRTKSIEIFGESAKAMVEIEHGTSGDILGEFEWKFQQDAGNWKLTAAPLPPA